MVRKIDTKGNISIIAGTAIHGNHGDGGPATKALLGNIAGINFSKSGNLYITDAEHRCIRMVDKSGIISTIAGNGTAGCTGDGGSAKLAEFNDPLNIVTDKSGNIYVADAGSNEIRKINASGIISTIAGNCSFAGSYTGDGGPATAALLSSPTTIVLDIYGNLFIADQSGACIRKIDTTGIIKTIAGTGVGGYSGDGGPAKSAQLDLTQGIGIDSAGNIYLADAGNNRIRKVNVSGTITTIAGNGTAGFTGDGGSASSAEFNEPAALAIASNGNIYIGDYLNHRVRMINKAGIINTVAGSGNRSSYGDGGPALDAELSGPGEIRLDNYGNVYITDGHNNAVRKAEKSTGIITTVAGANNGDIFGYNGDGILATAAWLNQPGYIYVDNAGDIYISDGNNKRVRMVNPSGIISTVAGNGTTGYSGDGGPATAAELAGPDGVVKDKHGNLYISDAPNYRVRKVDVSGKITTFAGNGTFGYSGDGGPATAAECTPTNLLLDKNGDLIISDLLNRRIRKVDTTGKITTIAGTGTLGYSGDGGPATAAEISGATGMIVDTAGNIYFNDYVNLRLRKISTLGIISTIAGNGSPGYGSTSGPATAAQFDLNSGLALDSTGVFYVADAYDNDIRRLCPDPASPGTITGNKTVCPGSIQTYSINKVTNAYSYTWSLPAGWTGTSTDTSITVTVGSSGGKISVVSNGICSSSTTSSTLTITVKTYVITVNPSSINICSGSQTTLNARGALTYSWAPAAGLSNTADSVVTASPAINTTYTVTGTFSNGCVSSDTISINVYPVNGFDLTGNLYICIDTPSFSNASISACIFNNRCLPTKGTLKLVVDTAFHISHIISDSTAITNGDTLIWHYDSLSDAGNSHNVSLSGNVDSLGVNDSVFVTEIITPIAGDSVPSNNSVTYWVKLFPHNCVGLPFDPNTKSVLPAGNITDTTLLHYTIHFQNTGTAICKNVIVLDTLSQYLDPTTLTITSSSSTVAVTILAGHIAKFEFDNIDLPDTTMSKTTSIGVVKFNILPLSSDIAGSVIKNKAGIYFDGNPVVTTNSTINIISSIITSIGNITPPLKIACFPNPFITNTSIVFNSNGAHYLDLYDITGRKLEHIECTGSQYELKRNDIAAGVYFIKAYDTTNKNIAVSKLIVQ